MQAVVKDTGMVGKAKAGRAAEPQFQPKNNQSHPLPEAEGSRCDNPERTTRHPVHAGS